MSPQSTHTHHDPATRASHNPRPCASQEDVPPASKKPKVDDDEALDARILAALKACDKDGSAMAELLKWDRAKVGFDLDLTLVRV